MVLQSKGNPITCKGRKGVEGYMSFFIPATFQRASFMTVVFISSPSLFYLRRPQVRAAMNYNITTWFEPSAEGSAMIGDRVMNAFVHVSASSFSSSTPKWILPSPMYTENKIESITP